ncbi:hypothetical protein [Mesorhizobium sp.]|uniref:hypothetical protein n=1 Tax=Mesorhizobium sp. TaxID=1871066 RepID=UPI00120CF4B5|nr:hypothetical protein [Mesorhizobium sp.]TIS97878.1 MAG: hypothetical protein E5W87_25975 [Mesorhizobium sp.]
MSNDKKAEFSTDLLADLGQEASGYHMPEISNRDHALFLIEERDLEAQLIAIKSALRRNQKAEEAVSENIRELEAHIRSYAGGDDEYQMHIEGQWVDALHDSVFQDAAHSMAAVGMLAPFTESLFVTIFAGLRMRAQGEGNTDPRATAAQDQYWNPQIVFRSGGLKDDLVAGIAQLSTSTGLQAFLPDGYEKTLSALFGYRNNMFHNGFEWPLETRQKFANRIKNDGWPTDWFQKAMHNNDPWIFYMSATFIERCLETIDYVLDGIGRYLAREKI